MARRIHLPRSPSPTTSCERRRSTAGDIATSTSRAACQSPLKDSHKRNNEHRSEAAHIQEQQPVRTTQHDQAPSDANMSLAPSRRMRLLPALNSLASRQISDSTIRRSPARQAQPIRATRKDIPGRKANTSHVTDSSDDSSDMEQSLWCSSDAPSSDEDTDFETSLRPVMRVDDALQRVSSPSKRHGVLSPKKNHSAASPPNGLSIAPRLVHHSVQLDTSPDKRRSETHKSTANFDEASTVISSNSNAESRSATPDRPATPPPSSPSKSRLKSPSKQRHAPSTPPGRPSLDNFWDAEQVNTWHDRNSPQKIILSPVKNRFLAALTSQHVPFTAFDDLPTRNSSSIRRQDSSPAQSVAMSSPRKTKAEREARRTFDESKDDLARGFLAELDDKICEGKVSAATKDSGGVKLVWSNTLNSTAGRATWKREKLRSPSFSGPSSTVGQSAPNDGYKHHATIELATKVITEEYRLFNTLAHEFCHLATYIVSGVRDRPHGAEFKSWGAKCTRLFGASHNVEVTTRHNYEVEWKYLWVCAGGTVSETTHSTTAAVDHLAAVAASTASTALFKHSLAQGCGATFGRHSKSIDPARQRCATCKGILLQVRPAPRKLKSTTDAQVSPEKHTAGAAPAGGFAGFVKTHFKAVREELVARQDEGGTVKHALVMEELGRRWKVEKAKKAENVQEGHSAPVTGVEIVDAGVPDVVAGEVEKLAARIEVVVIDD